DLNDLMIITQHGLTIRLAVSKISLLGRATQGVRLINLKEEDRIASVARVANDVLDDETIEEAEKEINSLQDQNINEDNDDSYDNDDFSEEEE
ncbi:MAG TPA: DNA gyrase C-terminal beta-propeller domain-containing protein, partial [Mariniphaga sp.]|nr:DNA gyrase C-terminal beta-propeller domain-containing protein [Mariniphaga sp.]